MPVEPVPQQKSFWRFWTTLPGVLTGIAGLIGAFTTLYIALHPVPAAHRDEAPTIPSNWPPIAEGRFTNEGSEWAVGNFPEEPAIPRFELRLVDGIYRWEIESQSDTAARFVISAYPSAVNFTVAVDVRFTEVSLPASAALLFGSSKDEQYNFSISSNGYFTLTVEHLINQSVTRAIDWTPIGVRFAPNAWNRMTLVVDGGLVRCYLNSQYLSEYRFSDFAGGKVGLEIQLSHKASAVIDFDNFEFRRKP